MVSLEHSPHHRHVSAPSGMLGGAQGSACRRLNSATRYRASNRRDLMWTIGKEARISCNMAAHMCRYGRDAGDTGRMNTGVPSVPTEEEWVALGFHSVSGLAEGWQSRVFTAEGAAGSLVVKLTEAHLVDRQVLEHKATLVEDLARLDTSVVAPVLVCGSLVHPFGEWLVTATPFIDGNRLEESNTAHNELLGASLAGLHRSMREVPAVDIPRVAALRSDAGHWGLPAESDQLLHGDFSTSNVILSGAGVRIFDFDDCGYGPIEYDVAMSIYMVAFDSWIKDGSIATVQAFRSAFVSGYSQSSDRTLEAASIDSLIDTRVMALKRWAANPSTAPIGIRNAPAEWIETLDRFVREWFSTDGEAHA
jgi:Ser/Thr protein kinase RdoA (MazF antagonist)